MPANSVSISDSENSDTPTLPISGRAIGVVRVVAALRRQIESDG